MHPVSVKERSAFSGVRKLLKLLLVLPAMNKLSSSALRRVKIYLRTTLSQERLNHLMTLRIHKKCVGTLQLQKGVCCWTRGLVSVIRYFYELIISDDTN